MDTVCGVSLSKEHVVTLYACVMVRAGNDFSYNKYQIKGMVGRILERQEPGCLSLSTMKRRFDCYTPGKLLGDLRSKENKKEKLQQWNAQQAKERFEKDPDFYTKKALELFWESAEKQAPAEDSTTKPTSTRRRKITPKVTPMPLGLQFLPPNQTQGPTSTFAPLATPNHRLKGTPYPQNLQLMPQSQTQGPTSTFDFPPRQDPPQSNPMGVRQKVANPTQSPYSQNVAYPPQQRSQPGSSHQSSYGTPQLTAAMSQASVTPTAGSGSSIRAAYAASSAQSQYQERPSSHDFAPQGSLISSIQRSEDEERARKRKAEDDERKAEGERRGQKAPKEQGGSSGTRGGSRRTQR